MMIKKYFLTISKSNFSLLTKIQFKIKNSSIKIPITKLNNNLFNCFCSQNQPQKSSEEPVKETPKKEVENTTKKQKPASKTSNNENITKNASKKEDNKTELNNISLEDKHLTQQATEKPKLKVYPEKYNQHPLSSESAYNQNEKAEPLIRISTKRKLKITKEVQVKNIINEAIQLVESTNNTSTPNTTAIAKNKQHIKLRFFNNNNTNIIDSTFTEGNETPITNQYAVFSKLINKKIVNPSIIVKPNRSKEYFQNLQNKEGVFIKMKPKDEYFRYSAWKLNARIKKIRGKYLEEVERALGEDQSKGAMFIRDKIEEFKRDNPELVNADDFHLQIRQAIVGKAVGHRLVRFRAKGRVNFIERKLSSLRIQFIKVPKEEICQNIVKGRTPVFLRQRLREVLFKSNASLQEIKDLSFAMTSRGMEFQRRMFKELIYKLRWKYFYNSKVMLNNKVIEKELLNELGKKMVSVYDKYLINPSKYDKVLEDQKQQERREEEMKERYESYTQNLKYDY